MNEVCLNCIHVMHCTIGSSECPTATYLKWKLGLK